MPRHRSITGRRAIAAVLTMAALAALTAATPRDATAATGSSTIRVDQRGPANEAARGGCWRPTDQLTGEELVELCDVDDGAIDGIVTFAGIAGGDYTLHQTRGPDIYDPAGDITTSVGDDQTRTVVTHHAPFPRLVVTTTNGGAPLAGSCFLLRPAGQQEGGEQFCDTTDGADGVSRLPVGAPGEYDLLHTVAPDGYALADTRVVAVADTDVAVTIELGSASTPVNLVLPSIAGSPDVGRVLTGRPGAWTPDGVALSGSWLRCDAGGQACIELVNATDRYTVTTADLGSTLRYRVTATAGTESATASSDALAVAALAKPESLTPPVTSGTARVGNQLTVGGDTWTGAPIVSVRWQRCDAIGSCVDIAGALGRTYRTVVADADLRVRAVAVATNTAGATSVATAMSAPIDDTLVNSTPPTITGEPREGVLLTAQSGSWFSYYGNVQFRFAWFRCTAAGCTPIGVTTSSYRLTAADVGARMRVDVTGTDLSGSVTVTTPTTGVVIHAGPFNVVEPAVYGTVNVGNELESYPGVWSGTGRVRVAYQWQRCRPVGTELTCTDIPKATGRTYDVVIADGGAAIRLAVTATDSTGSTTALSAPTVIIVTRPPVVVSPPTISGNPIVGTWLTAQRGTWFSPVGKASYRYEWMRCSDAVPTRCTAIDGATGLRYKVTRADVGFWLRMRVDARNAEGTTPMVTPLTYQVVLTPPENVSLPTITGAPRVGTKLVGSQGTWFSADGTLDYQYQWVRMDPVVERGEWIPGATGRNYTPTRADAGYRLRLLVIVDNHSGETGRASVITTAVLPR